MTGKSCSTESRFRSGLKFAGGQDSQELDQPLEFKKCLRTRIGFLAPKKDDAGALVRETCKGLLEPEPCGPCSCHEAGLFEGTLPCIALAFDPVRGGV